MIKTAFFGLLLALPALSGAQESTDTAELARIDAQRDRAETEFASQERACYARFAVNDCIETARKRRRDAMAELRRQEIAINDAERRRRAAARVRELEARQAEQRVPAAAPAGSAATSRDGTALAEPAPRPSAAMPAPERGKARSPGPAAAETPATRAARTPSPRPAAEAQDNARRYQERMLEAEQHRKRVQEKAAENNKASRPLPVPP